MRQNLRVWSPLVLLAIVTLGFLPFVSIERSEPTPVTSRVVFGTKTDAPDPNEVLRLVNAERTQRGLRPLTPNLALSAVAEQRAQDMERRQYYAHRNPDGLLYSDYMESSGYSCENLDLQFTAESAAYVNDWMNSRAGHRECLLRANVDQAGYAVAVMDEVFANGQATQSFVIVAIHAEGEKLSYVSSQ